MIFYKRFVDHLDSLNSITPRRQLNILWWQYFFTVFIQTTLISNALFDYFFPVIMDNITSQPKRRLLKLFEWGEKSSCRCVFNVFFSTAILEEPVNCLKQLAENTVCKALLRVISTFIRSFWWTLYFNDYYGKVHFERRAYTHATNHSVVTTTGSSTLSFFLTRLLNSFVLRVSRGQV